MTNTQHDADFDFLLTLHLGLHGWTNATFYLPDGPRSYSASQVFGCPFAALLSATTLLIEGGREQRIEWFLEPASVVLVFKKHGDHDADISISCWEHERCPAPESLTERSDPVWVVVVSLDFWAALIHSEFQRITMLLRFPEHAASRRWGFSASELARFENAVRKKCGPRFLHANLASGLPEQ